MVAISLVRRYSIINDALKIFLASLFLALMAQIAIFLPISPVPINFSTVGIFLIAATLGKTRAALAVTAYIAEGIMGFPVFAGGASGLAVFLGPRGLFLASFILAAYIAGYLYHSWAKGSTLKTFVSSLLSNVSIYMIVLPIVTMLTSFETAFWSCMAPFIIGDVIKALICNPLIRKI